MHRGKTVVIAAALGLLTVVPPATNPALGCAVAQRLNEPVAIATETAIIIWDEASRTQHFIRWASFDTHSADFGFLVPTPSQPTLEPAGEEAFTALAKITAPRVVKQPRPAAPPVSCGCPAMTGGAAPEKVEVLEEKTVGKYHAAVLAANSPDALADWLKENGYESSPGLTEWLAPYVEKGWKVTAFKIEKTAANESKVTSGAVRMSFKTDRPFFPYREPATAQAPSPQGPRRLLRVYFLADKRYAGALGDGAKPWPGKTAWANKVSDADRADVLGMLKLPPETGPAAWWLTEFEDRSSPREGVEDLYFSPSETQAPVERPPHVQYVAGPASVCVVCCAMALYMSISYVIRQVKRARRGRGTAPANSSPSPHSPKE